MLAVPPRRPTNPRALVPYGGPSLAGIRGEGGCGGAGDVLAMTTRWGGAIGVLCPRMRAKVHLDAAPAAHLRGRRSHHPGNWLRTCARHTGTWLTRSPCDSGFWEGTAGFL